MNPNRYVSYLLACYRVYFCSSYLLYYDKVDCVDAVIPVVGGGASVVATGGVGVEVGGNVVGNNVVVGGNVVGKNVVVGDNVVVGGRVVGDNVVVGGRVVGETVVMGWGYQ